MGRAFALGAPRLATARAAAFAAGLAFAPRARADGGAIGNVDWRVVTPADRAPPARSGFGLAYDGARAVTLLFGGANTSTDASNDLWSWDGSAWRGFDAPIAPLPRVSPAMAFDDARGKLVVFGGAACAAPTCGSLADTWEWDGAAWTQGPAGPSARFDAAMAYDPLRRKIVLFGGAAPSAQTNGFAVLGDTWEYDGAWTEVTPPASPAPRRNPALTFDGARLVLLGGESAKFPPSEVHDMWTFDGAAWTPVAVPTLPGSFLYPATAFDAARGRVLFYGAGRCLGLCSGYQETWEWDGAAWRQMSPSYVADTFSYGRLAWDASRRRGVLVLSDASLTVEEYEAYGESCAADDACNTFHCDGKICCTVACGPCADCDFTGTACAPVRRQDDLDSCTGAMTCAADATCKKKMAQPCKAGDECASGICTGGLCCGTDKCAPYACGADGACGASCASDASCAPGYVCVSSRCVPAVTACDGTVAVRPDGARAECAPYACSDHGCVTSCRTSDDCAPGHACGAAQTCVPARAGAGGACAAGGAAGPSEAALVALAAGGAALARRRRRRGAR